MRISKKDIYKKYGIDYNSRTGKINTPIGPTCELLKEGNSKVGKKVRTWSMTQKTCACHCPGCYGDAGFYNMPSVKKSLENNTALAMEYTDFLGRAIRAQLETLPAGTEVRIHALGDFFSAEYAEMWHDIVRDFQQHIFWTYTKRAEYESLFNECSNGNIVKSMVGSDYNFGHCDHIMKLYNDLQQAGKDVYICRCGIDNNQHCAGCHMCSKSEYVLFLEHSTGYNAVTDPLYKDIETIINNQQEGRL